MTRDGAEGAIAAGDARADAVVLLSGGLDSATTLAMAVVQGRRCVALSVDYGQRHRHELMSAAAIASRLGAIEHVVLRVDLGAVGGSALTADIDVPKAEALSRGTGVLPVRARDRSSTHESPAPRTEREAIPVTYVPARNALFLSLALGLAEARGAREIWLGVNAVDYSGYPDCRPGFIEAFERMANLATRAGVVAAALGQRAFSLVTPIIAMSKAEIIRAGATLGVRFEQTHSCYDPVETGAGEVLACGRCASCRIRAEGFAVAGINDPTRYASA